MQLALHVSPYYYRFSACDEIWLNLAKGDIPKAVQRCAEIEPLMKDYEKRGMFLLGKVSLLYAQGSYTEILSVLEEPMRALEQGGAYWHLINLMPIQALALKALGREEDALSILSHCLTLAEPEGYVRAFVEKGLPMVELLKVAMGKGIETEYIKSLLPAFHTPSKSREPISPQCPGRGKQEIQWPAKEFVEPISERELEILRLLESSMNTPEIARELYISVGTVRTHIKNIYRKLDVNRRMEAVQRATELGLI
jgi:LuxR family maltose regulon positive regulatory protein